MNQVPDQYQRPRKTRYGICNVCGMVIWAGSVPPDEDQFSGFYEVMVCARCEYEKEEGKPWPS